MRSRSRSSRSTSRSTNPSPGSSRCSTRSGSVRCRSRSADARAARVRCSTRSAPSGRPPGPCAGWSRAAIVGVRGPFGAGWARHGLTESDVLIVGGGIGIAPLRPVVRDVLADREHVRTTLPCCSVLARRLTSSTRRRSRTGGREPMPMSPSPSTPLLADGQGNVGLVTALLDPLPITLSQTTAFLCGPEVMIRVVARDLVDAGADAERIFVSLERNMHCAVRQCGHCQLGPAVHLRRRPGRDLGRGRASPGGATMVSSATRPTVAVWKFASCDGCQLSLLDCEDELLAVADRVQIAYFLEATRATVDGPYDLSLVEGSVTTEHDVERIKNIRAASRRLVTIGACATAGGIQALRNYSDVDDFVRIVYATPSYISTLSTSTPISAHVAGRLRAPRLPHRQAPTPRRARRLPRRAPTERGRAQRVRRVQAARQRLRDGG